MISSNRGKGLVMNTQLGFFFMVLGLKFTNSTVFLMVINQVACKTEQKIIYFNYKASINL